ncbi:class I SAM-dependent methyltransferase [Candidatus Woesebacteria bacterium]|nr:class I SAM-dependent methyltransferase [Candidatus Woesebacteria bacterium]
MKKCDFCSGSLLQVYSVPASDRGAIVCLCEKCGLAQSIYTKQKNKKRVVSTSSGAGWGNIRHGKKLRLDQNNDLLKSKIPFDTLQTVLDIGANRGDFIFWLKKNYPGKSITAVEPDKHIVKPYKDLSNLTLLQDRFEKVDFAKKIFDFIYCFHTLEHADSAKDMFVRMFHLLSFGGYAFIEVPNIAVINYSDTVEEFFYDKHAYHFDRDILCQIVRNIGFDILSGQHDDDNWHITLVLQKNKKYESKSPSIKENKQRVETYKSLIKDYAQRLQNNREKLKTVTKKLEEFMDRQKVVLWGAGRIFDALVRFGGLTKDHPFTLVDSYLGSFLDEVHGTKIEEPDVIRLMEPDVVIILAVNSTPEIEERARSFGVRHVFRFRDLLR